VKELAPTHRLFAAGALDRSPLHAHAVWHALVAALQACSPCC
jgi:hypothetical protein